MYLVNSNLAKPNSLLTRTKLVYLDQNLRQGGKSGGCGYRRRSSRIWHPAVLVKTRVWVGCTVLRAQKNTIRRSWCSLFEEWCVIFYNHSAWRVIFLLDFRDWWISFETTIGDKMSWDTLPKTGLFYVLLTSKGGNIAFLPHPFRAMLCPCSSYL